MVNHELMLLHTTVIKKSKCEFRRLLRQKFRQFEKEENERIDNLVEVDQKAFWKVVNSLKLNALLPELR